MGPSQSARTTYTAIGVTHTHTFIISIAPINILFRVIRSLVRSHRLPLPGRQSVPYLILAPTIRRERAPKQRTFLQRWSNLEASRVPLLPAWSVPVIEPVARTVRRADGRRRVADSIGAARPLPSFATIDHRNQFNNFHLCLSLNIVDPFLH